VNERSSEVEPKLETHKSTSKSSSKAVANPLEPEKEGKDVPLWAVYRNDSPLISDVIHKTKSQPEPHVEVLKSDELDSLADLYAYRDDSLAQNKSFVQNEQYHANPSSSFFNMAASFTAAKSPLPHPLSKRNSMFLQANPLKKDEKIVEEDYEAYQKWNRIQTRMKSRQSPQTLAPASSKKDAPPIEFGVSIAHLGSEGSDSIQSPSTGLGALSSASSSPDDFNASAQRESPVNTFRASPQREIIVQLPSSESDESSSERSLNSELSSISVSTTKTGSQDDNFVL
jgi:hypothetical protein